MLPAQLAESFEKDKLASSGRAAKVTYDRVSADFVASEVHYRLPRRGEALTEAGGADVELRAAGARGNLSHRRLEAFDGVTLKTGSGLKGRTQTAHYDGEFRKAHGSEQVELEAPTYRLTAKGFELRFDDEEFSFLGGVTTHLEARP